MAIRSASPIPRYAADGAGEGMAIARPRPIRLLRTRSNVLDTIALLAESRDAFGRTMLAMQERAQ